MKQSIPLTRMPSQPSSASRTSTTNPARLQSLFNTPRDGQAGRSSQPTSTSSSPSRHCRLQLDSSCSLQAGPSSTHSICPPSTFTSSPQRVPSPSPCPSPSSASASNHPQLPTPSLTPPPVHPRPPASSRPLPELPWPVSLLQLKPTPADDLEVGMEQRGFGMYYGIFGLGVLFCVVWFCY